jgi:ribonuclease HII
MILGGIDEAGRGPVLGPLVVAGVASDEDEPFADLGLKDSKLLTPRAREKLAAEIRGRATRVEVINATAEEIDAWRKTLTLNEVEVRLFTMVARALRADAIIVDAADPDAKRFGVDISVGLRHPCKVFSAHHADRDEPIVSAASIIAKTERDRQMQHISRLSVQKYGLESGSGYASDPITQRFLDEVVRTTGDLPIETRRSWATSLNVLRKHGHGPDARLDQFIE